MDSVVPQTTTANSEYKIVVVGDTKSGKTALIQRFMQDTFNEVYVPTGFDRYSGACDVEDKRLNFTIWDTSGSPQYASVRHLAYPESRVFILCFHVGQPDSLDNVVTKWYPEVRSHCPSVPVVLCGCQSDARGDVEVLSNLAKQRRIPVTSDQAQAVCKQVGAVVYVETSARTKCTKEAFEAAVLLAVQGKLRRSKSGIKRNKSFVKVKFQTKVDLKAEIKQKARSCVIM